MAVPLQAVCGMLEGEVGNMGRMTVEPHPQHRAGAGRDAVTLVVMRCEEERRQSS